MKRRLSVFVFLLTLMGLGIVQSAAAATPTVYSGRGVVVDATVLGIDLNLGDTGPLPQAGGALEASLLETQLPNVLEAGVAHATTIGQSNYTHSQAAITYADLGVGGVTLSADLIMASAEVRCAGGKATVTGSSTVVNLVLNGQPIEVTGKPNQTIQLPLGLGQLVINEQTKSVNGREGSIVVNALHLTVTGVADVVLSRAEAGIACRKANSCPATDKITAAGIMDLGNGGKASFAVAGGIRNNNFFGHLRFDDRNGTKVTSTSITGYEVTGAKSRRLIGTAKINGSGNYTFTVDLVDNGKPTTDTIRVRLSNGYDTGVKGLTGQSIRTCGNIKLHKACK